MIKILDELERLRGLSDAAFNDGDLHDSNRWEGLYLEAADKALPALIRVARAAEAYTQADALSWRRARDELAEALQALRNLKNPAAEMAALQQEVGLDD